MQPSTLRVHIFRPSGATSTLIVAVRTLWVSLQRGVKGRERRHNLYEALRVCRGTPSHGACVLFTRSVYQPAHLFPTAEIFPFSFSPVGQPAGSTQRTAAQPAPINAIYDGVACCLRKNPEPCPRPCHRRGHLSSSQFPLDGLDRGHLPISQTAWARWTAASDGEKMALDAGAWHCGCMPIHALTRSPRSSFPRSKDSHARVTVPSRPSRARSSRRVIMLMLVPLNRERDSSARHYTSSKHPLTYQTCQHTATVSL